MALPLFKQLKTELVAALGTFATGGIIEHLEWIGAAGMDDPAAPNSVAVGLSVWPFPLVAESLAVLAVLGYAPMPEAERPGQQTFQNTTEPLRLAFFEAGSARWTDLLVLRDALRQDQATRAALGTHGMAWLDPSAEAVQPALTAARAWWVQHHGFRPVEEMAREFEGFPGFWCISSGWALDLFLGRVTRVHHDVDMVVARSDQLALHAHMSERGWSLLSPFAGQLSPWLAHTRLELPRHQAHAHRDGAFLDLLLTDIADGVWRYRRQPTVLRALEQAVLRTPSGLPFLAPELVLLFKSQNTSGRERSKDQGDWEAVWPHLEPERRAWLRWALLATAPTHPWLDQLRQD